MNHASPFAEHATRLTREIINALVSEHDDTALAERIGALAAQLSEAAADPAAVEVKDPMARRSRFPHDLTPVSSSRNPIAPPLDIRHTVVEGAADAGDAENAGDAAENLEAESHESYAEAVLPLQYQGPPQRVHGGIVALMLDQILGDAAHSQGLPPAFTRELTITYDAATPIDAPLRVAGRIGRVEGRKRFMEGEITVDGQVTARAKGLWISPRVFDPTTTNAR